MGEFLLSWRRSAAALCALVRACDVGPDRNASGVMKLLLPDGSCVLVGDAVTVPGQDARPDPAAGRPGLVVAADDAAVTVATADGLVRLSGFATLDGGEVALTGIRAGMTLPEPYGALVTAARAAVAAEPYWLRRLTEMTPLWPSFACPSGEEPQWRSRQVAVPAWAGAAADPAVAVAEAALEYLGQVTGEAGFDVGLRMPDPGPLLADVVPLRFAARAKEQTVRDQDGTTFAGRIADAMARGSYLRDMVARYPELAGRDLVPPVVVDVRTARDAGQSLADACPPAGAIIEIRASADGECVLLADESAVPPATVLSLARGLTAVLAGPPEDETDQAPAALATGRHWQSFTRDPAAELDLAVEAVLPASIAPSVAVPDPMHVVLTGATGFVGAFLLHELVAATGAVVHCVVRAADHSTAAKRIRRALEEHGLWTDELAGRIRAWAGDLTEPLLGLTPAEFGRLALAADAVYHAGALVSAIMPYPELSAANVGGTGEALALAARHRPSAFHHISTSEVFGGTGVVDEDAPPGPADALRGGYAQAKWVAEQLVVQAAGRGLPAAIYRLPRILGDTSTGVCVTRDPLWRLLKGCVQAGAVPSGVDAAVQLAPADWAASAVVALSRGPARSGAAYHVAGPDRVRFGTLTGYLRAAGYRLRDCPLPEWAALIRDDPANAATPLLDVFLAEMTGHGVSQAHLGTAATVRALSGAVSGCPGLTRELFGAYLRYLTQTGYLPAP